MDLQSDVKAYLEIVTEEQRAAWMINLQLSYASRAARASHSSEPSQSVASLPMTNVERRAEEPLDSHRTWEPPDAQELAQYAPQPGACESSEDESGTTHQFQAHSEPSDPGSVQQPEEELTHEATALPETAARPPITPVTEPPAPSAVLQQAPPTNTLADEPPAPASSAPPAEAPATDTTTPVKARPPMPTALPCAQPTPPTEPKAPEPTFHHPQPKVFHMDKNKQTHWLQPSDDEMDPTASASTGQPLPPATRPVRPPGSDVWWVAEPITNPDSPRHQPKPIGPGWVSYDGSWWRNYWQSHGNSVPEEATRACPAEYTYSHDPAFWYNSRVWVHPYRPEHEAFLKDKKPKPSAAFKAPPTMPTPSSSFPPANSHYSPRMEFKWGEPLEPPAPGFDKPGQTKPSSLYNVRNEQKALAQLHQGYAIWIRGRWKWAPRTALNSQGNPMFGYYDDRNHMCCAEPCGTQPECPHDSLCGKYTHGKGHLGRHECSRCHEQKSHGIQPGPI